MTSYDLCLLLANYAWEMLYSTVAIYKEYLAQGMELAVSEIFAAIDYNMDGSVRPYYTLPLLYCMQKKLGLQ